MSDKAINDLVLKNKGINDNTLSPDLPMINPAQAGGFTIMPSWGKKGALNFFNKGWAFLNYTTLQVKSHVIVIPMSLPGMLDYLPNTNVLKRAFYHLLATAPRSITGLTGEITVNVAEGQFHNTSEKIPVITGQTKAQSNITREYTDVGNGTWQSIIKLWIDLISPNIYTGQSGLMNYLDVAEKDFDEQFDKRLDIIGASVLYIEPDSTQRYVIRAWMTVGEFPTSSGTIEGKRTAGEERTLSELSIPFKHMTFEDENTRKMAQKLWDDMRKGLMLPTAPNVAQDKIDGGLSELGEQIE